jgi:hypothetical protein
MSYFKTNLLISFIVIFLIESSSSILAVSIENKTNLTSLSSSTKLPTTSLSDQNTSDDSVALKKSSIFMNGTGSLTNKTDLIDEISLNNTLRERRQICKRFLL